MKIDIRRGIMTITSATTIVNENLQLRNKVLEFKEAQGMSIFGASVSMVVGVTSDLPFG